MKASFRGKHGEACNVTVNINYGCCNKNCKEQVEEAIQLHSSEDSVPAVGAVHPVRDSEERQDRFSHKPQEDDGRELKGGVDTALNQRPKNHSRCSKDFFPMDPLHKGIVLIINNNFHGVEGMRKGSEIDVISLYETFAQIGACKKDIHENLSSGEIFAAVKTLANSKKKASFYAIFVMSHGELDKTTRHDIIIGEDGTRVSTKELVDLFAVPHLTDTPVLMFFQMCRAVTGEAPGCNGIFQPVESTDQFDVTPSTREQRESEPMSFEDLSRDLGNALLNAFPEGKFIEVCGEEGKDEVDMTVREHIEKTPNMLVSFSTAEGHFSIRNSEEGSWYIQELCKAFKVHAPADDVVALMNRTHDAVNDRRSNKYTQWQFACRTAQSLKKKLSFFSGM